MHQSPQDVFTLNDEAVLAELGWSVLAPGGHGHLFCSWTLLPQWFFSLKYMQEEVSNFNVDPDCESCI